MRIKLTINLNELVSDAFYDTTHEFNNVNY